MLHIALMVLLVPAGDATAAVEGKAVNSATGEPLRRAEVSIQRPASGPVVVRTIGGRVVDSSAPRPLQTATTDDGGRFSISGLAPGTYTLSASRTGYLAREYDARGRQVESPVFKLTAGQVLKDQVIKLTPQGVITGRVFDDEGNPAAKASVKLLAWGYSRGARRLLITGYAETDNRGEYRIASVAPGKYYLAAAPPALLLEPGATAPGANRQMGLAAVYYPGLPKPAPAAALEFDAGAERNGMDLRLQKADTFRIRGKVLDSSGAPVGRADLVAMEPDLSYRAGYQPCFSQADGSFEIAGIPRGVYRLYARLGPGGAAERIVEVAGADVDGVVMAAGAGRTITGRVALEEQGTGPFRGIRVVMQRTDAGAVGSAYAEVRDDGSFTLASVRQGRYQLTVAGLPEAWYVVSSGLPGREMDFTNGVPESLQLTLGSGGGRVTGTAVHGGKPVAGAFVAVLPLDYAERPALFSRMVRADQKGGFTVAGIAPGDYRVLAWEDAELGAVQDLDFLRQFDGRGQRIKVGHGKTVEAEAAVIGGQ